MIFESSSKKMQQGSSSRCTNDQASFNSSEILSSFSSLLRDNWWTVARVPITPKHLKK